MISNWCASIIIIMKLQMGWVSALVSLSNSQTGIQWQHCQNFCYASLFSGLQFSSCMSFQPPTCSNKARNLQNREIVGRISSLIKKKALSICVGAMCLPSQKMSLVLEAITLEYLKSHLDHVHDPKFLLYIKQRGAELYTAPNVVVVAVVAMAFRNDGHLTVPECVGRQHGRELLWWEGMNNQTDAHQPNWMESLWYQLKGHKSI